MKRFDTQRLRLKWVLGGVFLALAGASTALVLQSFDRLRLESFHAQRALAEEVVVRINGDLRTVMAGEEARPPTDYDFLVVSGERYVQRSPLSALNPDTPVPGVVGYFQVDADGRFSTPLLPADLRDPEALELTRAELEERRAYEARLRRLLEGEESPAAAFADSADHAARRTAAAGEHDADPGHDLAEAGRGLFEQLSSANTYAKGATTPSRDKLEALELEESLARRAESQREQAPAAEPAPAPGPAELRREVRQVVVPAAADDAPLEPRISAFESAVAPLSLALLDDDHFVLFRKVWLEGHRIQGMVVAQAPFLDALVGRAFAGMSLAQHAELVVAFGGDVVRTYPSAQPSVASAESRNLLLRRALAAPAGAVELVFSVAEVPLGPGASALSWAAAIMALVLAVGFYALYRLGRHHIRLAEQQQDFVSAVSHELKTPLTSIRMYGEILKAGWADEDKKRTYYDYILSESERLSRLIGNVLQLARITRGGTPALNLRATTAAALLDQVESKVASPVAAAGLTLEQECEAPAVQVAVDEDAFMQVMINLVDNAIKFSAHAERRIVELGCRLDGGWVEFRVRDHGPGVDREQMRKIFRLFYRSENELTRETVGTGIGLALVRELVEQMGGRVDVVNRQPGAEFTVRLPRVPEEPGAAVTNASMTD